MQEYIDRLEEMLLHTFSQIEKSKTPDHNMNWFTSEDARVWYSEYKNKPPYVKIAEELNKTPVEVEKTDKTLEELDRTPVEPENVFDGVYNPKD
jgi:hypothetical protein